MPRYIDADKLKETITDNFLNPYERNHIHVLIDIQPTADVQEVKHASYTKNECCTNCGSARATDNRYGHIPKKVKFSFVNGAKKKTNIIKPCPLCNKSDVQKVPYKNKMYCPNCKVEFVVFGVGERKDKDKVIDAWNSSSIVNGR